MTVAAFPVGRLIVHANNHKDLIPNFSLENKINNLVDLIKLRTLNHSLEEVADGLLPELFELRIDLLEYLASKGSNVEDYFKAIDKEIANNLNVNANLELSKTIATSLEWYSKIIFPLTQRIDLKNFGQLLNSVEENRPNYGIVKLLSYHPSPQVRYIKNWADSSLAFEVGLIVSDLVLTGKLELTKTKIRTELIDFVSQSLTKFGAYSIFTGFWSPDTSDNSHVINKMRILNSTMELEHDIHSKLSEEGFLSLINN